MPDKTEKSQSTEPPASLAGVLNSASARPEPMEPGQPHPNYPARGYVQAYTGDGKGKTTASMGLILRALGRGWRVLLILFTKGGTDYGELHAFRQFQPAMARRLTVVQAGLDRIVFTHNLKPEDASTIQSGWTIAQRAIQSGQYQLIVMDEANIALDLRLIPLQEMKQALLNKPVSLEIVLTGRRLHPEIEEIADLVSEVVPRKHYWDQGVKARRGIEY